MKLFNLYFNTTEKSSTFLHTCAETIDKSHDLKWQEITWGRDIKTDTTGTKQLQSSKFGYSVFALLLIYNLLILDPVTGTSVTVFTFNSDRECQLTPMA